MRQTNELLKRISDKLQAFVNNPNDALLTASIRSDMIALRGLRDRWNALPSAVSMEENYGKG